jgi:hypothetical protein
MTVNGNIPCADICSSTNVFSVGQPTTSEIAPSVGGDRSLSTNMFKDISDALCYISAPEGYVIPDTYTAPSNYPDMDNFPSSYGIFDTSNSSSTNANISFENIYRAESAY